MFGSFLPSAHGWFRSHQSLLGCGSRHCHGINNAHGVLSAIVPIPLVRFTGAWSTESRSDLVDYAVSVSAAAEEDGAVEVARAVLGQGPAGIESVVCAGK